jgi:hypothetical protein
MTEMAFMLGATSMSGPTPALVTAVRTGLTPCHALIITGEVGCRGRLIGWPVELVIRVR